MGRGMTSGTARGRLNDDAAWPRAEAWPLRRASGTFVRVKPLLITALGRTISPAPLGRREDDVEVRRVPVLPAQIGRAHV